MMQHDATVIISRAQPTFNNGIQLDEVGLVALRREQNLICAEWIDPRCWEPEIWSQPTFATTGSICWIVFLK